jgi:osmotically-inducible protein OsmY
MRIRTIAIAGLAGAAVAYLFDPIAGSARRSRIRERLSAFARRRATPQQKPPPPVDVASAPIEEAVAVTRVDPPNSDAAIADRIRTRVQGRPDLETGGLVVEVLRGVAFLRGDLKDRAQIDEVVDLTGAVPGVQEVQNLIHLPESQTISRPAAPDLGDRWNG